MLTSSRDNWERLMAAVVKREEIWQLCHQPSRSPSISTITSDDLSEQIPSFSGSHLEPFSVPQSPLLPSKSSPSISQVYTTAVSYNASSSAWYRRRKSKDQDLVDIPVDYPEVYLGQLKIFSFRQLQVATNDFSKKNIIWRGKIGNLYKGRLVDGTLVTINRLQTTGVELGFQTEVDMFNIMPEHRNLLSLRGFCMTHTERVLVYPYMVNGSVASRLRERSADVPPLDWWTRKRIALGSARGLSYLHNHCDPKIIHRKVKASNILLDEDNEAVVGDFSLAILMDHNDTHGHITPEYISTRKMYEKGDVYGYGFMLLELITGQKPFDFPRPAHDDNLMLLDWVYNLDKVKGLLKEKKPAMLVDPDLQNNYVEEEVEELIQVALLCTQTSALGRPKMSEVVKLLKGDGLAEKWDEWQKASSQLHVVELLGPR